MNTKSLWSKLALVLTSSALALSLSAAEPKKVLVVTVTTGFRHGSIATAEKILAQLAKESGGAFTIVDYARQPGIKVPEKPNAPKKPQDPAADANEDAQAKYKADLAKFEAAEIKYKADLEKWDSTQDEVKAAQAGYDQALKESLDKLSVDNLKKYDAVIFANTTGNLPLPDKQGFIDWVHGGHAFIAMHSGSDTLHERSQPGFFQPYIDMLGGEFAGHGDQVGVECLVQDKSHPATKALAESFCIEQEEIYLIKSFDRAKVHGLLALDKHPNKKKELGYFPIAWCKEFGQGKVFYTSLGHNEIVWENKRYQKHILGGIKWALGLEKGDATLGN
jgi:type 1 glutamine amidotransferase